MTRADRLAALAGAAVTGLLLGLLVGHKREALALLEARHATRALKLADPAAPGMPEIRAVRGLGATNSAPGHSGTVGPQNGPQEAWRV